MSETNRYREELAELIRRRSLRIGEFVLSSGKKASFYLDCRMTTLDPRGAWLVARLLLDRIRERGIHAEAIGGMTLGADPIAAAVAVVSGLDGAPLHGFIVRKEAKGHGAGRVIEGFDGSPGTPVVVVDDVCTTGGSILQACDRLEEAGYRIAAVMCIVDREEGGSEAIRRRYPFEALFTVQDLLDRNA